MQENIAKVHILLFKPAFFSAIIMLTLLKIAFIRNKKYEHYKI